MTRRRMSAVVCTIVGFAMLSASGAAYGMGYPFEREIHQMAAADEAVRGRVVEHLRGMGPRGLARVRAYWEAAAGKYADLREPEAAERRAALPMQRRLGLTPEELDRLRESIDRVAGQKDATYAWLYWHTDLAAAQAEARKTERPILSLRLLGELTDEYSCANSRFFRTVLYANPEVAEYLREHYVLHWETVRPVPVITIDFGDGRSVKRTITGNSIHYVLDADGRVIDAVPGLYAPGDFLRVVSQARAVAANSPAWEDATRMQVLARYRAEIEDGIARRTYPALDAAGVQVPERLKPDAADAAPRAVGKARIELPVLVALDPAFAAKLERELTGEQWAQIAERTVAGEPGASAGGARLLHERSIELMRDKGAEAYAADPGLLDRTVANFERAIRVDTARNEVLFRGRIHRWLAKAEGRGEALDVAALNGRVYDELFLTPGDDPTLGLIPEAVYTALPGR